MKLFTVVSHFFYFLLIFRSVDGGICHGNVDGVHGVLVFEMVARKPIEIQPGYSHAPWVVGASP